MMSSSREEKSKVGYINKRLAEVKRDNLPAVTPGYRIQAGYRGGIGLQIIVDEAVLTREVIDNAIRSFLAGDMPLSGPGNRQ